MKILETPPFRVVESISTSIKAPLDPPVREKTQTENENELEFEHEVKNRKKRVLCLKPETERFLFLSL